MSIIKFEITYDQELVNKILLELYEGELPVDSHSMLEISQVLGKKYKEGSPGWKKLRLHLVKMSEDGLLEERHFGKIAGDWNKRVDYVLENKGIKLAEKLYDSKK